MTAGTLSRRQSLAQSLTIAATASVAGAALIAALAPLAGEEGALRATVAILTAGVGLHSLYSYGRRTGCATLALLTLLVSGGAAAAGVPLAGYVLLHAALLWLVRAVRCYSGPLPALADLGLTVGGVALGAWAAVRSGSPLLALWCFFLPQALTALLPASFLGDARTRFSELADEDPFDRAHRAAESALSRLPAAR